MDAGNLLEELASTPGPVGQENEVQLFLKKKWASCGFDTWFDPVGNLFGKIDGEGPLWIIVGHADSIGFITQDITPDGFVKVAFNTAAATPDARFLPGKKLRFLAGMGKDRDPVGYFGLYSGHLAGIEGKKKPVLFDDMFVDLGVDSDDAVRMMGIDIGTSAVFATEPRRLNGNIVGPAMDDRVAGTIQCLLAGRVSALDDVGKKPNLLLVSTVQEEIGMKGAAAAAAHVSDPRRVDIGNAAAIVIDVGLTGDIPPARNEPLPARLGGGPITVYKDFSIHYSMDVITKLQSAAAQAGIGIQKSIFRNYRSDGMYFYMEGIPTALLAIPCRYTHTDFETVAISDVEASVELLLQLFKF